MLRTFSTTCLGVSARSSDAAAACDEDPSSVNATGSTIEPATARTTIDRASRRPTTMGSKTLTIPSATSTDRNPPRFKAVTNSNEVNQHTQKSHGARRRR